jgi:hypothetical protein
MAFPPPHFVVMDAVILDVADQVRAAGARRLCHAKAAPQHRKRCAHQPNPRTSAGPACLGGHSSPRHGRGAAAVAAGPCPGCVPPLPTSNQAAGPGPPAALRLPPIPAMSPVCAALQITDPADGEIFSVSHVVIAGSRTAVDPEPALPGFALGQARTACPLVASPRLSQARVIAAKPQDHLIVSSRANSTAEEHKNRSPRQPSPQGGGKGVHGA